MNGYKWIHDGLMLRGQLEQRKLHFSTKIYKNRFTKQTKQTDRNNHQEQNNQILDFLIISVFNIFVFVVYFFRRFLFVWCLKKRLLWFCFSSVSHVCIESRILRCWPHVSIMRNRLCHFYHPQTQNFGISTIPRHGNGFMAWGGSWMMGPWGF